MHPSTLIFVQSALFLPDWQDRLLSRSDPVTLPPLEKWRLTLADIFREVDEDLRQENLHKLWKKYGKFLLAFALAIVLGTAAYVGWKQRAQQARLTDSAAYSDAITLIDKDPAKAQEMLLALAKEDGDGYGLLARFRGAAVMLKQGQREDALTQYDALSKDTRLEDAYRSLANILWALTQLDGGNADAALMRVKDMTAAANPYHFSALEISALASLQLGDAKQAKTFLTLLADDPNTPAAARARATELLAALKE